MKILLGPSSYAPNLGGIEHLTEALATELRRMAHDVAVVTNRWPESLPTIETVSSIEVRRIEMPAPSSRPADLVRYPASAQRARSSIREVLDSFRPDVVHAVGASWQAVHLAAAAHAARVPFVLNLQGETAMDDERIYQRSVLLRRAYRRLVGRASAVVACSQWTLDHGATIAPETSRGHVIPNGVDYDELAALGPPPSTRRVLAFGRLVHNKGFDLLIRAAVGAGWELAIGGAGPAEAGLRQVARECGVEVDWLGRLDRVGVVAELARAAAVAVPSRVEPFGIVALEAMAAGRPVVVSTIGGMPEFMAGGLPVDPTNSLELRHAIEHCLAEPALGDAGRLSAESFAWPRVTLHWLELYASLGADGPSDPGPPE